MGKRQPNLVLVEREEKPNGLAAQLWTVGNQAEVVEPSGRRLWVDRGHLTLHDENCILNRRRLVGCPVRESAGMKPRCQQDGGAVIVVRAQENCAHGEGRQVSGLPSRIGDSHE
jgi:hypothetical protein